MTDERHEHLSGARRAYWVVAIACFVLTLLLVWRGAYQYRGLWCAKCGLMAHEDGILMGDPGEKPILRRMRYRETAFHRLHRRLVGASCRHEWRWTCYGGRALVRGMEYGDAFCPPVLCFGNYDDGLATVEKVASPERARVVLMAIDLEARPVGRTMEVLDALEKLSTGATPAAFEAWWRKNQGLFAASGAGGVGKATRH